MLSKHGITPNPDTIAAKSKELRKKHDVELLEWVKDMTCAAEVRSCIQMLKEELEAVNYLPVQPYVADLSQHVLGSSNSKVAESDEVQSQSHNAVQDFSTINLSGMNFCVSTEPKNIMKSACDKIYAKHMGESDLKSAVNSLLKQDPPSSFQIIGDNIDMHIIVRHMSTSNNNKSLHTFNLVAMKDIDCIRT